ncbi:hypothetical protein A4X13_0g5511 [Tilletia indica]|uniref:Uncharacterized protein n=1 Tax=Tilletia indica TaxID=43049 RepID=A0A177TXR0_9BASI|nr:hypothetical protein A4X13_0g5511 [Tilletia indica]
MAPTKAAKATKPTHESAAPSRKRARSDDNDEEDGSEREEATRPQPRPKPATSRKRAQSIVVSSDEDDWEEDEGGELFLEEEDDSFADSDYQQPKKPVNRDQPQSSKHVARSSTSSKTSSKASEPVAGPSKARGQTSKVAAPVNASKGKGKAINATTKDKGDASADTSTSTRAIQMETETVTAALTTAMKLINPAIGLQATQATSWASVEAHHATVALDIERNRLLRLIATALALQLQGDDATQMMARIEDVPRAQVPSHFVFGMRRAWAFIGSPFAALSTIASTISWLRRQAPPRLLAGSRTSPEGGAVESPVTAERLPLGFSSIGDNDEDGDIDEDEDENDEGDVGAQL